MVTLTLIDTVSARLRSSVSARHRDAMLFVLLAMLFGISFVAIKTGLRQLPPVLFAGLRFDIAAGGLLGYVMLTRERSAWLPQTRGDLLGIGVAAVFLIALNNGFLFAGQVTTTPAAASVMYGLNPILAPMFAWWLLGERISGLGALGIGVALAGVIIIVQPSPSALADTNTVGQLFVLGAAAAVAFGSVSLQRVGSQMESVPLTAWAMGVGAVLLHTVSLGFGESPATLATATPATAASVLVVGIFSTALAYPIYFGLISRAGPVRANLVAYVVPIVAALSGWLLLGSAISLGTVAGFFIVVAGFGLIERAVLRAELRRFFGEADPPAPVSDD